MFVQKVFPNFFEKYKPKVTNKVVSNKANTNYAFEPNAQSNKSILKPRDINLNHRPEDEMENSDTESTRAENDGLSSEDEDYAVLPKPPFHHIILDFSSVNYIDTFGVKSVYQVITIMKFL